MNSQQFDKKDYEYFKQIREKEVKSVLLARLKLEKLQDKFKKQVKDSNKPR